MTTERKSIVVVGAGISGMSTALKLAQEGHRVTVLEATGQAGGLGASFEYNGRAMEKFPHFIEAGDHTLRHLIQQLGLGGEVFWQRVSRATVTGNKVHRLSGRWDRLGLHPGELMTRARAGLGRIFSRHSSTQGLDDITAAEWLEQKLGKAGFESAWKPELIAQFGDAWGHVPALWAWMKLHKSQVGRQDTVGYLQGGYHRVGMSLVERLAAAGVNVRFNVRVNQVDLDEQGRIVVLTDSGLENYQQAVLTTPVTSSAALAGPRLRGKHPHIGSEIDYLGCISCVVLVRRSFSPHTHITTVEADVPFDRIVNTSRLITPDARDNWYPVYLTKVIDRRDARFSMLESEIRRTWLAAFHRLFPQVTAADIESIRVFKASYMEPVYAPGFLHRRPPETVVPGSLYLATSAQIYPHTPSWNGALEQAERTVEAMKLSAASRPPGWSSFAPLP